MDVDGCYGNNLLWKIGCKTYQTEKSYQNNQNSNQNDGGIVYSIIKKVFKVRPKDLIK